MSGNCPVAGTTIFGFDYGERRLGVAVGQTVTHTAAPLAIIAMRRGRPDWEALTQLCDQYAPQIFVVGMPAHDNGSAHRLAALVTRFCDQLRERFRVPVLIVNEHLSSVEARQRVGDRRAHIDAAAAQVILETWMNENCGP